VHDLHAGKRPEIFAAVFDELAGGEDAGEAFFFDDNERVGFVVFQLNVVERFVLFDQAVFEQQSVGFRRRNEPLDVVDLRNQQAGLAVLLLFGEVAGDALFEVFCFAHVEQSAVRIEILVHAGLMRHAREGVFDVFGFCHGFCEVRADSPTKFAPWFLSPAERGWLGAIWWMNCCAKATRFGCSAGLRPIADN